MAYGVNIRAFSIKIPPALQCSGLFDSPVWLASMGDAQKKSLNTKIKSHSVKPTSK